MSDTKHTPEPWKVGDESIPMFAWKGQIIGIDIDGEEFILASCNQNYTNLGEANARRIVACVNACAGMADPAAEIAKLRAEREELREAITGLLDAANRNVGGMVPGGVAYWCHSALGLLAEKGE